MFKLTMSNILFPFYQCFFFPSVNIVNEQYTPVNEWNVAADIHSAIVKHIKLHEIFGIVMCVHCAEEISFNSDLFLFCFFFFLV